MERIWWTVADRRGLATAAQRYGLIERAGGAMKRRGLVLLAWGIGEGEVRLVVDGGGARPEAMYRAVMGIAVGTTHAASSASRPPLATPLRAPVDDVVDAVCWAHRAPRSTGRRGPLWSPWTSHRDLLRFRHTSYFDPAPLERAVDGLEVHARCGGRPLPAGWPPPPGDPEPLSLLLRVAGAVLGVLPADRRCFRLFVHLARTRGWRTVDCAHALALTRRRIRQLARVPEPRLPLALTTLGDHRLCRVP